ncbi:MAG: DUF1670 domain-containing protein [Candidatus Poribacteria bacterium]
MINNSALDRWNRLRTKNLNQQFLNEIITGLNCSPFEAGAILDTVHKVFGSYFETGGSLQPGQIPFQVVSIKNGPQVPLAKCEQVTVTLTLDAGEGDLKVKEQSGVVGLRRRRIERICFEAYEQGGLLTVEDLASRLLNLGERTICRDLAYFREQKIFIPLRSTVKDMGRTLSHRIPIVKQWLQGKEYTEIARNTCHSVRAVRNYVEKFKRVVALSQNDFDLNTISFLAKVAIPVVSEYLKLYKAAEVIGYRKQEIENFFKRTQRHFTEGGADDYSF